MRRRFSGTGCGACGRASQARLREASGHRPPQLRGAAHSRAGRGRTSAAKAACWGGRRVRCPTPEARPRGAKSPQWSAERRVRRSGRPRRQAWTSRALLGAPLLTFVRAGMKAPSRALQKTGAVERWLNCFGSCLKIESEHAAHPSRRALCALLRMRFCLCITSRRATSLRSLDRESLPDLGPKNRSQ